MGRQSTLLFVALLACSVTHLAEASLRGLSSVAYGGSYGSGQGSGCTVGNSCRDYCGGWLPKKPLYWITSCPREYRDDEKCLNMKCVHTSVSEADTEGCFCCCGEYSVPGAVFNDCQPGGGDDDDDSHKSRCNRGSTYELAPPSSYKPAPVYQNPSPVYHNPAPVYHNPAPVYHNSGPSYGNPGYGNPGYGNGNGADVCRQAGENLGFTAGQMACDAVYQQCNARPMPFAGGFPSNLPANCRSIAIGYCLPAAQQYADRVDPGCGQALRSGFGTCNSAQTQFHWNNAVQRICN
mmetsp:Transcript_3944/g.10155  ORF Transcript_3944/g.10155 Transcript_3944/m.10155 type:complete len:293 (-) Transcript_3944:154-1032(-)